MNKLAYITVRVQVPLRGKETPKSVSRHVVGRLKDAGFVSEIVSASYTKEQHGEETRSSLPPVST